MFELFETFSSTSFFEKTESGSNPEWNPFSQRLLFELRAAPEKSLNEADYVATTLDRLLLIAHEATHVFLWEPFFSGHVDRVPSPSEFADISVCFEGFCFWYADIVVTRNLRMRLPDGEFARGRSAASQSLFHPYRAFEASGIRNPLRILDTYLNAFRGYVSLLSEKRNQWLFKDLFERFTLMSIEGIPASKALLLQYDRIGVFREFYERFTKKPGLPSLLPSRLLRMNLAGDPAAYCRALARVAYAHLHALSDEERRRVRMRRAIQTRAYTAYSLRCAFSERAVMTRRGVPLSTLAARLIDPISSYIDRLEGLIDQLADGTSMRTLERRLKTIDSAYEVEVRAPLSKASAWLCRRHILYPAIGTRGNELSLQTPGTPISLREMRTISNRLIEEATPKAVPVGTSAARRISRKVSSLLEIASGDMLHSTEPWKASVNALLLDPLIIGKWSLELATISPLQNRFREVLFSFA